MLGNHLVCSFMYAFFLGCRSMRTIVRAFLVCTLTAVDVKDLEAAPAQDI